MITIWMRKPRPTKGILWKKIGISGICREERTLHHGESGYTRPNGRWKVTSEVHQLHTKLMRMTCQRTCTRDVHQYWLGEDRTTWKELFIANSIMSATINSDDVDKERQTDPPHKCWLIDRIWFILRQSMPFWYFLKTLWEISLCIYIIYIVKQRWRDINDLPPLRNILSHSEIPAVFSYSKKEKVSFKCTGIRCHTHHYT